MKILLLNQCFYPDVASTAQHLSDLAVELVANGHDVTVIAADRGYDNSSLRFRRSETWRGVRIIRIPSFALGKSSRWRRAVNFASFLFVCAIRLLFSRKFDVVIGLTSPPLVSVLGSLFVSLRGGRFIFWVMDLNPDEAIAAGWLKPNSLMSKFLSALLRFSLHHADKAIVLDRFMKQRIIEKGIAEDKIEVIPPWSHNDAVSFDEAARKRFRHEHGLTDKFVVMYSGNHSPCHSLDTLLASASRLANDERITFCFVGGGSEYEKVQKYAVTNQLHNVLCLPYQPLSELSGSLSAADLHVVVMGDRFTGIVHPCKMYNILEISSPVLYIGPDGSHVTDVLAKLTDQNAVCIARHGDVQTVTDYIANRARRTSTERLREAATLSRSFSRETLLPAMLEVIESSPRQLFKTRAVVSDTKEQLSS